MRSCSARWIAAPVVMAAVLSGACDPTAPDAAPLGPTGPELAEAPRPFTLTLVGHANPDFSQGPCDVVNTESGTGVALHMGEVTWASEEQVDFCVDPADPQKAAVVGDLVVMAANGDRLTASYDATVHADFVASTLVAEGAFVLTGGTGRFREAAGGGSLRVAGSLVPPFEVEGVFTGAIDY